MYIDYNYVQTHQTLLVDCYIATRSIRC